MSFTVTAPSAKVEGVSTFGPVQLHFQKGIASAPELSEGLAAYLHSAGYTVEEDSDDAEPVAYDPAKSSIPDVLEYLSTAEPEERERVLAAEAEGKARKGILEATTDAPEADAADAGDVLS